MKTTPILKLAEEKGPSNLDAYGLMIATRDILRHLHDAGSSDLIEGTLELMDMEAVKSLEENLKRHASGAEKSPTANSEDWDLEDHEVQELASAILTAADANETFKSDFNQSLGSDTCKYLAMSISTWMERYNCEETGPE